MRSTLNIYAILSVAITTSAFTYAHPPPPCNPTSSPPPDQKEMHIDLLKRQQQPPDTIVPLPSPLILDPSFTFSPSLPSPPPPPSSTRTRTPRPPKPSDHDEDDDDDDKDKDDKKDKDRKKKDDDDGLSRGALAGIIVGSIAGAILILVPALLFLAKRRRAAKQRARDGVEKEDEREARAYELEGGVMRERGEKYGCTGVVVEGDGQMLVERGEPPGYEETVEGGVVSNGFREVEGKQDGRLEGKEGSGYVVGKKGGEGV